MIPALRRDELNRSEILNRLIDKHEVSRGGRRSSTTRESIYFRAATHGERRKAIIIPSVSSAL